MKCGRCGGKLMWERMPSEEPEWKCQLCGRTNVPPREPTAEEANPILLRRRTRSDRRMA